MTATSRSTGPSPQRTPDEPPPSPTLPHLVRARAEAAPDSPALVAGDVRWSWAELDDAVRRSAGALSGLGVGPGSRVGLLATNTASWLAAAVGAMWDGARVDAFHTWVKAWDLEHLLGSSGCEVLVVGGRVRGADMLATLRELVPEVWSAPPGGWSSARFPALRHVVVVDGHPDPPPGAHMLADLLAAAVPAGPGTDAATPGQPAYVMYTSGSTRHPKAVPLCQRDLLVNGFHIGERMGLGPDDRVWLGSPLFWSYGGANALPATWTHGACLVLQEQFDAGEAAALLAREYVTAAYLLPGIIDSLAGHGARVRGVTTLRTGLTIGRPEEVARAVDELDVPGICNIYGATETYGNCCVTHHEAPLELRLTTQGPPLPGVEVRTVDPETGAVLDAGERGELQVRGRVTPGYLGDAEATAAAFTTDGWYRTGDRLRVRPDGAVEFGARLTDMIKTSGINVAPAEVESYLAGHPDVLEVAVVGAPHPSRGEVVVAFVTVRAGGVDGPALRAHCQDGIAGFKVPWEVVVIAELPRTPTGKLTRRALVERAAERVGGSA